MGLTKLQKKLQDLGVPDRLVKLKEFPRKAKVKFCYTAFGGPDFEGTLTVDGLGWGWGLRKQIGYACTHCREVSSVSAQEELFVVEGGSCNMAHTRCRRCGKEDTIVTLHVEDVAEIIEICQGT